MPRAASITRRPSPEGSETQDRSARVTKPPFLLARSLPARRRLGSMAGLAGLWVLAGTFATWPFQGYEPLLRGLQRQFTWLFNSWPVLLIQLFPDASRNLALVKLLLLAGAALLLLLSPRKPRLDDLPGALAWSVAGQLVFLLVASQNVVELRTDQFLDGLQCVALSIAAAGGEQAEIYSDCRV